MTATVLDLTNVISVTIQGSPTNLNLPIINTVALFSKETPTWGDAFKIYTNASAVSTDFGSTSVAFQLATAFFAQQPNPLGTGGYLVIIPRTSSGTETTQAAIARTKDKVFYAGVILDEDMYSQAAAFASLATYVQTLDKLFFPASSTQATYAPGGMFDLVRSGSETHTRCLYYYDGTAQDTLNFAAAYAARAMSTDFTGSNTAQTMHLKSLAGITADTSVDQTELTKCQTAGVDVYVNVAGVTCAFTSGQNSFFDEIYNELWLKFALETAGFNYLRVTGTKVPQTEVGIEGLKNAYRTICLQAVNNGFIGPGTWTSSQTFGDQAALIRCIKDIGFYVYSTPLSQQAVADRTARVAPLVQIAIKAQGAVHKSNVVVNVNL